MRVMDFEGKIRIRWFLADLFGIKLVLIPCQTIEFLQKDFKEIYISLKQRQYIDIITS